MLKITCYNCHWSWSLNRDAAQAVLDALKPDEDHVSLECPRCRRVNKVAVRQLRRTLPHRAEPTESDTPESAS